jgi:hypothetical protein
MHISLVLLANELFSTGATAANTTSKTDRPTNPCYDQLTSLITEKSQKSLIYVEQTTTEIVHITICIYQINWMLHA